MAVTSAAEGTQAATVTTEHTLSDLSVAGVYTLLVDTVNMVNGDALELRLYSKGLTGGTLRVVYLATYANVQADPIKISVPIPVVYEVKVTLKQTTGTSRNFDWCLMKL